MKLRCVILAFACMVSAAAFATEAAPRSVSVPAGDLVDALESLAKQCEVDIVYPGGLLKGLKTRGVTGTLEPMVAFKALLQGTPLVLKDAGGALLITQAADASRPAIAHDSTEPLSEVEIESRYEKLSVMRKEVDELEDQFYAQYNELNTDPQYDVYCSREISNFMMDRVCRPVFVAKALQAEGGAFSIGGDYGPAASLVILLNTADYKKHMVDVVSKHPELLALLEERKALAQRYEAVRKQKLKAKFIVWD